MPSWLTFLLVLSVLVVVHEYGHFIVARLVGIRVEKFSIGFGPVIFSRKSGETEFCFSLLPLGGFVKLAGEDANESKGASWEFGSKPLLQKFAVVFAGPVMNALLAFILFTSIYLVGQPILTTKVGKVLDHTPAKEAGMLADDRIVAVNGIQVRFWEELLKEIHKSDESLLLLVERKGATLSFPLKPKIEENRDVFGKVTRHSFIGVAPSSEILSLPSDFPTAVRLGAERVVTLTLMIFSSLWLMATGAMPFKESLTGPIGIFVMTQQAAQMGIVYLFYFMGSWSVSLFVLNILPIPVLDGGHMLFILLERLKGKPLSDTFKERMTQGGLAMLLALMAVVIFQDIQRFAVIENVKKFFGG